VIELDTNTLLWDRWLSHASRKPSSTAIVHYVAGEEPFVWSWKNIADRACRYAAILRDAGVRPGQVCALILRHHREFYPIYMAVEALGALPAVLAYPNPRLHPDKFRQGLEGMAQRSGLDFILTERELEPMVRPLVRNAASTIKSILFPLEWSNEAAMTSASAPAVFHQKLSPDSPCLLQHSSGTTGLQKPVVLSHRAILEHVQRYGASIVLKADDKVCSWLPLYHDMGLIAAFHMPLAAGIPTIQIDPFEWVIAPVLLFDAISTHKATLCWLPNFAYNHMAERIHDDDLEGIRLDSIRMFINCSEPVRASSHDRFAQRFEKIGVNRSALAACYAMAETTFAVTQTPPGSEAPWIDADRQVLRQGRFILAQADTPPRRCVSSGAPIDGCDVRIVDERRAELPDGQVGEIVVRSVSIFDGYSNNPEQTAKVLEKGWYYTGDYGFRLGREHYIIGRKKDIIIVAGKNLYPEDIEDAVNSATGVYPGRVIAFGAEDEAAGTEQICVVAETDAASDDQRKHVRRAVVEAGMRVDVTISRVYLVPPRWLIKSSAGKPSRSANRDRALSELTPVE
jgi:acyl-CoA synthetase (AMP-forming)/AMP-acid ligase II